MYHQNFMCNSPLYESNTFCLPVHRLKDFWVAYTVRVLLIMLLWMLVYNIFNSLGYTCKNEIVGWYNSYLNFLRTCRNVFSSSCTDWQYMRVSISPHSYQHLFSYRHCGFKVGSHRDFDFPEGCKCWESFHVFIDHL